MFMKEIFQQKLNTQILKLLKKWLNSYPDDFSFNEYFHDIKMIAKKNNYHLDVATEDIENIWYSL